MADIAFAFAGQTRISKPHPEGTFAPDRPIRHEHPMIWVGTPVRDDAGQIIAVLSLGVSADYQFTRTPFLALLGYRARRTPSTRTPGCSRQAASRIN